MLSRFVLALMALSLVVAVVGCEGETGPPGPAGPAGSGGAVVASAEINGFGSGSGINASWPANVSVTSTKNATGEWTVVFTGTFPSAQGVVAGAGGNQNVALGTAITAWSTSAISIDVEAWNTTTNNTSDVTFTLVIFEGN